jgi:AMMECR1 domain-containing protein
VWDELSNPEEFFSQLSLKAGLEPNSWKNNPNMKVFLYQVEKFAEE